MFCKECGNKIENGMKFCSNCGTPLPDNGQSESGKVPYKVSLKKKSDIPRKEEEKTDSAAPIPDNFPDKERIVGEQYIFNNVMVSPNIWDYFIGGKVSFEFKNTNLYIEEEALSETKKHSFSYTDIKDFHFENKIYIKQVLIGIAFAVIGIISLGASDPDNIESAGDVWSIIGGILCLILGTIGVIRNVLGTVFTINTYSGKTSAINLKRIKSHKLREQKNFCRDLDLMIKYYAETGDVQSTPGNKFVFCRKCGKQMEETLNFCEYCGNAAESSDNTILDSGYIKKKSGEHIIVAASIIVPIILGGGIYSFCEQEETETEMSYSSAVTHIDDVHTTAQTAPPVTSQNIAAETETSLSTTAAPAITTIVTEITEKESQNTKIDYMIYSMMINEIDYEINNEYGSQYILYYQYYLYDINQDGIYELLIHIGESEAEAGIIIFTLDENEGLVELGEINGGHMFLTEKDGMLYSNFGHMGYQIIERVEMVGGYGAASILTETVFEEDNLVDYIDYGSPIKAYDMSDTSPIEALYPKEYSENKPYVDAYVKTYSYSGFEGAESRLYADGDFSYIKVQIVADLGDFETDYIGSLETYTKAECEDYIELNFNAFADPPSFLMIVPFNDAGIAGDMINCEIPRQASDVIASGGYPYSVEGMRGEINCHGGTIASFTTDYVCYGGRCAHIRDSLGNGWHVTAKNTCINYGITWYELWDTDDGDYYGWVDSNYIDFY